MRTPQPGWPLSPEDRDQAGRSHAAGHRRPLMAQAGHTGEAQVTVTPVQHPVPGAPGVAEPGDREPRSTRCQRTSARGGRHSTAASCRGQTSHSTRPGHARETRCRHQRRTRAMPGSRSCRHALMPMSGSCRSEYLYAGLYAAAMATVVNSVLWFVSRAPASVDSTATSYGSSRACAARSQAVDHRRLDFGAATANCASRTSFSTTKNVEGSGRRGWLRKSPGYRVARQSRPMRPLKSCPTSCGPVICPYRLAVLRRYLAGRWADLGSFGRTYMTG